MKTTQTVRKSTRISSGSKQIPVISTRVISEGGQSGLRHSLRGSGKVWKKTLLGKKFEFAEKLKEKRNYIMYLSGMGHEKKVIETIEQIPQDEPKDKIIEERQIIDNYNYHETKDLKKKKDPRKVSVTHHQRLSSPFERTVLKKYSSYTSKPQQKPYVTTIKKTNYTVENNANKYNSFTAKQEKNKTVAPSKLYETYKPVKNNQTYSQTKTTTTSKTITTQNRAPVKTSINQYQSKTQMEKTKTQASKYVNRRGNAPKYESKNLQISKYNRSETEPNRGRDLGNTQTKTETTQDGDYLIKVTTTKTQVTGSKNYGERRQGGYESKYGGPKPGYKPRAGSVPRGGERPRGFEEESRDSDRPRANSKPRDRPGFAGPHGPYGGPRPGFGGPHGPHGPYGGPRPGFGGPHGHHGPYGGPRPGFGGPHGPHGPYGGPKPGFGGPHGPHGPYGGPRPEFGRPQGPHGPYGGPRPAEKPEDKEDRASSSGRPKSSEKPGDSTGPKPGTRPGFGGPHPPHRPGFGPHGPQGFGPHGPGFGPHGPQGFRPGFGPHGPGFGPQGPGFGPHGPRFGPQGPGFGPHGPQGFRPGFGPQGPQGFRPHGPQGFGPHGPQGFGPHGPGFGPRPGFGPHGPGFGQVFQHLPTCPLYPGNLEAERRRFLSQQKAMRSFEEKTFSQSANRPFIGGNNYGRPLSQPRSGERRNLTLNTESNSSNIGGVTQIRIQQTTGSLEDGSDNYNYYESKNILKKGRRVPITIHHKREDVGAYTDDIPEKYNRSSSYINTKYSNKTTNLNNTYTQSLSNLNRQKQGVGSSAGKGGSQYTQKTSYKQVKTTSSSGSGARKAAGSGAGYGTSSYSEYKKYEQKGKVGSGAGSSLKYQFNQSTDYKRGGASSGGQSKYQFTKSNQYIQGRPNFDGYDEQYQYTQSNEYKYGSNNLGDFSQYQYFDDSEFEIIDCPVHGRQTVRKNRYYNYY
jgi:hypothetical protein